MKKILSIIVVLGTIIHTKAQTINDVVRYGTEDLQGTARYQSLSGAFGALGGDLSALNNNPAGSAIFANSSFTISGTSYNIDNKTRYFDGNTSSDISDFDLNQLGGVLVFNNTNANTGWNKFSLAFNFEKVNNFENEFLAAGRSNLSIDEYFLNFADGVPLGDLDIFSGENIEDAYLDVGSSYGFGTQQAFLGLHGGIIAPVNPDDDNNTEYVSNVVYNNGTVNQRFFQGTSGYNNKFTFNMAGEYLNNFYLGASLNFHDILYEKYTQLNEDGYASQSFTKAHFDNLLRTSGSAFSFSVGGIAKVGEMVRLGLTYQSPTWYRLTDELSQRVGSSFQDSGIEYINFNQVNIFPDHKIHIPSKYTGSLALVFGKEGLLSFDYTYQDMSNAKLKPTSDPDFGVENNYINNTLKAVSTFRVGGEYRIERFSLRGGYRYEQSPYDNDMVDDLNGYSLGIGYDFGAARLDAAFNQYQRDYRSQLYETGLTNTAAIDARNTNVTLSLSLNL